MSEARRNGKLAAPSEIQPKSKQVILEFSATNGTSVLPFTPKIQGSSQKGRRSTLEPEFEENKSEIVFCGHVRTTLRMNSQL